MIYRFLGHESNIGSGDGSTRLAAFGQPVELSEEMGNEFLLGQGKATGHAGAIGLLPDEDFQAIFSSAQELKDFANPGSRIPLVDGDPRKAAQVAFLAKKRQALLRLDEIRNELEFPAPAVMEAN